MDNSCSRIHEIRPFLQVSSRPSLENIHLKQYFSWRDESFEESYGLALLLRKPNLLRALKNARTLKNISISYDAIYLHDPATVRRCWVPLRVFQGLTSLEIYNFYRDRGRLVNDIARALCNSPCLKKLGLG